MISQPELLPVANWQTSRSNPSSLRHVFLCAVESGIAPYSVLSTPQDRAAGCFLSMSSKALSTRGHTEPRTINHDVVIGSSHLPHLFDAPSHLVMPETRSQYLSAHIALQLAYLRFASIGCVKLASSSQRKICMQDVLDNVAEGSASSPYLHVCALAYLK